MMQRSELLDALNAPVGQEGDEHRPPLLTLILVTPLHVKYEVLRRNSILARKAILLTTSLFPKIMNLLRITPLPHPSPASSQPPPSLCKSERWEESLSWTFETRREMGSDAAELRMSFS